MFGVFVNYIKETWNNEYSNPYDSDDNTRFCGSEMFTEEDDAIRWLIWNLAGLEDALNEGWAYLNEIQTADDGYNYMFCSGDSSNANHVYRWLYHNRLSLDEFVEMINKHWISSGNTYSIVKVMRKAHKPRKIQIKKHDNLIPNVLENFNYATGIQRECPHEKHDDRQFVKSDMKPEDVVENEIKYLHNGTRYYCRRDNKSEEEIEAIVKENDELYRKNAKEFLSSLKSNI